MDHKKSYLLNGRNEGRIDIPAFDEVALLKKQGRIHDTLSRGGWAGAVMWWAGAVGSAVYTTASVTCHRAGAVMQKPLAKC